MLNRIFSLFTKTSFDSKNTNYAPKIKIERISSPKNIVYVHRHSFIYRRIPIIFIK